MDLELENLDLNSIDGHEWALALRESMLQYMDKCVLNWCKVVLELGHEEVELDKWLTIFKKSIEERCKELVVDVIDMKLKVIDNITELMQKSENYCRQLNLNENLRDINPNNRYYFVEKQLIKRTERLEKIMEERKEELEGLLEKQRTLCDALQESPYLIPISPLPTKEKIYELQQHIEKLEDEKFVREERYLYLKDSIVRIAKELDIAPRTDFERKVFVASKDVNYDIRKCHLNKMEELENDLSNQLKNMKDDIHNLKETVENLWTVLEESMTNRDAFLEKYSTYSVNTQKALRAECKRCEDLKKANIKIFVEKLRTELRSLWQSCFHQNEEEFGKYPWFTADFYTEDLLAYHEMEVNKWKAFYSRNKELIKLLSEHGKLWNQVLEMEKKDSEGLNRYKNRGGELLKEERERNKLSKKIPIIEEKIKEFAEVYENSHGQPFLYCGTPILEHLDKLHQQRNEEKKNKLSVRKQARDQETLTPAKSCLSLFPSSSTRMLATPLSVTKRKLNNVQSSGKKPKLTVGTKKALNASFKLNRSKRLSMEKNKRVAKCRKYLQMNANTNKENMEATRMTDYDDFEENVTRKDINCRSTLNLLEPRTPLHIIPAVVVTTDTPTCCVTPKTPKTNNGSVKPKTPRSDTHLTRTTSNLKLLF